eukprot:c443_g1_i1.p1 GENE.c443_g1_i1~~c443_g1_i1.p1  ORF type:complete len:527 (+),score=137.96 c443_g1_i1:56-1636(+)
MRQWCVLLLLFLVCDSPCSTIAHAVQTSIQSVDDSQSAQLTQLEETTTRLQQNLDLLITRQQAEANTTLLELQSSPILFVIIALVVVLVFGVGLALYLQRRNAQKASKAEEVDDNASTSAASTTAQPLHAAVKSTQHITDDERGPLFLFSFIETPTKVTSWVFAKEGSCPAGPYKRFVDTSITYPITLPVVSTNAQAVTDTFQKPIKNYEEHMFGYSMLLVSVHAAEALKTTQVQATTKFFAETMHLLPHPRSASELQIDDFAKGSVVPADAMTWLEYTALRSEIGLGISASMISMDDQGLRLVVELTDGELLYGWEVLSRTLAKQNDGSFTVLTAKKSQSYFSQVSINMMHMLCGSLWDCVGIVVITGHLGDVSKIGGTDSTMKYLKHELTIGSSSCSLGPTYENMCSVCTKTFARALKKIKVISALGEFVEQSLLTNPRKGLSIWKIGDLETFDKDSIKCVDAKCTCVTTSIKSDPMVKSMMVDAIMLSLGLATMPSKFAPKTTWPQVIAHSMGYNDVCSSLSA